MVSRGLSKVHMIVLMLDFPDVVKAIVAACKATRSTGHTANRMDTEDKIGGYVLTFRHLTN